VIDLLLGFIKQSGLGEGWGIAFPTVIKVPGVKFFIGESLYSENLVPVLHRFHRSAYE